MVTRLIEPELLVVALAVWVHLTTEPYLIRKWLRTKKLVLYEVVEWRGDCGYQIQRNTQTNQYYS